MRAIYRYYLDCGRMGSVEGLFVAEMDEVEALAGKRCYFGEILGKHSEIDDNEPRANTSLLSSQQQHVAWFEELRLATGVNPLDFLPEDEDER